MGQMLLGSSAINLPNFDRDSTTHLKRLFDFQYETLEVSHFVAYSNGEDRVTVLLTSGYFSSGNQGVHGKARR
jgi:hypothetical protein